VETIDQIGLPTRSIFSGSRWFNSKEVITEAMIIPEKFRSLDTDDEEVQD
jgi:hypothetical protein